MKQQRQIASSHVETLALVCLCLQELELRWQEYYEVVTVLLQWIRHHILVFEERKFPNSYEEIEVRGSHT